MTKTESYQLSQWDAADLVRREDFNSDNAKLDAALAEQAQALSAASAEIARRGNCRIVVGSYTGTEAYGTDNPCTLTFDGQPLLVAILPHSNQSMYGTGFLAVYSSPLVCTIMHSPQSECTVTWPDKGVSWYNIYNAQYQFNLSGVTYYYVALLAADE